MSLDVPDVPDVPDGADGADDGRERDLVEVMALLNALVGSWSTFRLYPNPSGQPAFTQALETMRSLESTLPVTFDVGAGDLSFSGEAIAAQRGSSEQLAKRLYLHDIEALTIEEPPSSQDVLDLFGLLVLDEAEAREQGGVASLAEDGAFRVFQRRTLEEERAEDGRNEGRGGPSVPDRVSDLAALVDSGADPDRVLQHLMDETGGDNEGMATRYIEGFSEIHDITDATGAPDASMGEMFAPYLVDDIGASPTGTFIEVFFKLPIEARRTIFASFVLEWDAAAPRMFLDQFSGDELLALADSLDESGYEAVMAYAADAAESDPDHAAALAPLLGSTKEVREARQATAQYAARLLDEIELGVPTQHLADEIRAALKPDAIEDHGRSAVRGLFMVVERPDRLRRLARIWASRIRGYVAKRDYERAIAEVEAVQREGRYAPEHTEAMSIALGRLVTAEFVADLNESEDFDQKIRLLRALGTPATRRLIELLADEEDAAARRSLLDLLAVLCRANPRPLIKALSDDRWYVVRNVAMILGKTGHSSAVRHLKRQLDHPDARVRVEVLRALMPLNQEEAVGILVEALGDENKRVRYAATTMLKAAEGPEVDEQLAEVLAAGSVDEATQLAVVDALAGRGTQGARQGLEAAAGGKRFSLGKGSRAVRNAARAALEGSSE